MRKHIGIFVKRRKEQDVQRVFNDCAVMAICKRFGNNAEHEASTISKVQ